MKGYVLSFIFLSFLLPSLLRAEALNVGFVQGLWYSSEPVFVGVPTRVYVAFRNNTESELTGTVVFLDNGKRVGTKDVSVLSGRIAEAWMDWAPTEGEHKLSATLSNASLHEVGEAPEKLDVTGIASEDVVAVDRDTDGDKTGNEQDLDDDNDGVTDADEKTSGTDPLVANPKKDTPTSTTTPVTVPVSVPSASEKAEGLEQFLGNNPAGSAVTNITDSIENAKTTLDAYRQERNNKLYDPLTASSSEVAVSTDNATITRSQIKTDQNIFELLWSGMRGIGKHAYTFALWVLSHVLAHPAFVELMFLLVLLYALYRTARRIGRRPNF